MRTFRLFLAGLIVTALAAVGAWLVAPPDNVGWDRLQTGVTIRTPPGDGPFPVAVLLHGCGGVRPFLERYADAAVEAGAAAVILDSLEPRGIGRARAVLSICIGADLRGGARARDVELLLENLRDPRLDMDRVALAGWSHGAWSVAELLTQEPAERGVRSAFLVYPYCRFPARWPGRAPAEGVEILAIVPDLDAGGSAESCRNALTRSGAEIVRVENATHAFEEDYALPFPFRHNAEAFEENADRFRDFLRRTLVD
jgi:dienelactone hydrolase